MKKLSKLLVALLILTGTSALAQVGQSPNCVGFTDGVNTTYPAPTWQAEPGVNTNGILYTGAICPAKVGIGTDAPDYTLDVRGSASVLSTLGVGSVTPFSGVQFRVASSNKVGMCLDSKFTTDFGYAFKALVDRNTTKAIGIFNTTLGANGEDVFRVYGDGRMECKAVKVSLDIWSDYVFADDYDLMALSDLKKYIQTHKHLPHIPSEKEVLAKGIDLGEQNALLLEKVEELTLYMIQLNERINALEAENKAMKVKVSEQY